MSIGLLFDVDPRMNPYVYQEGVECSLERFLENFNRYHILSSKNPLLGKYEIILKYLNTVSDNENLKSSLYYFDDLDAYLVERLTNINIINEIATQIPKETPNKRPNLKIHVSTKICG